MSKETKLYVRSNHITKQPFQVDAGGSGYLEELHGQIHDLREVLQEILQHHRKHGRSATSITRKAERVLVETKEATL